MKYSILALVFIIHEGMTLFFILGEKERRCFYEDYQNDVIVKFEFNATIHKSSTPIGLHISMQGPQKQVMLSKEYGSRSVVKFRTSEPGEYSLCVGTNSTKWSMYAQDTILVHFRLNAEYVTSEEDDDEKEQHDSSESHEQDDQHDEDRDDEDRNSLVAVTENPLHGLFDRVRAVKKDLQWLLEMQDTYRRVEGKFREIAEVTNFRVIIWAVIQLVILLATGWWQIRSLKSFFIAKKLV